MATGPLLKITDTVTTVDLLDASNLYLNAQAFETESFDAETTEIWEVYSISTRAAAATVRTLIKNLDKLFKRARDYQNSIDTINPVWLYWQASGESEKRSLVLDGKVSIGSVSGINPMQNRTGLQIEVAVKRYRFWENESATSVGWTITSDGDAVAAGTGAVGSENSRIAISDLYCATSAATSIYKLWVGFRPQRNGYSAFKSLWEAELGWDGTDCADFSDATAKSLYSKRITYATDATLKRRFYITIADVIATPSSSNHFIGSYFVLARLKLNATTTSVRVLLGHGWLSSLSNDEYMIGGDTYISGADNANLVNWNLVELGYITIPGHGSRLNSITGTGLTQYGMSILSERMSVAGTLDIDYLLLIPADHYLHVDRVFLDGGGSASHMYVLTSEDDLVAAYNPAVGSNAKMPEIEVGTWELPNEDFIVVGAHQQEVLHHIGSDARILSITLQQYPRWGSYRV